MNRFASLLTVLAAATASLSAQDPLQSRSKGSADAPVTVYEMSDFQCPYCRQFFLESFPSIERDFINTGKVRWVFVNFPLTQIHRHAAAAAEFAVCASRQGKFWPVHDHLFQTQPQWTDLPDAATAFRAMIPQLKLDAPKMNACIESGTARAEVRQDAEGSARSGARSTPTFYVEGGLVTGAHPYPVYRRILDSIVTAKRAR